MNNRATDDNHFYDASVLDSFPSQNFVCQSDEEKHVG